MAIGRAGSRRHLRLVEHDDQLPLPSLLKDRAGRKEVEQLTEALFDALVEMMDLVDGDPDIEPNGDEFEDSGGV